ncbi:MAG: hypothetical protein AAF988_00600 [Pseudomonadota bacterium]
MNEVIGTITVLMTIFICGLYIRDTIKGKIKPHPFSWSIWFIITGTIFLAQVSDSAGPGAWMNGVVTLINLLIAILALKNGFGLIKKLDVVVFIMAITAIAIWIVTSSPFYSVIILVIANTLGFIPTFRKSFYEPYSEPIYLYSVGFFRHGLSIIALSNYTLITALSSIMLVIINLLVALFLIWRRYKVKRT